MNTKILHFVITIVDCIPRNNDMGLVQLLALRKLLRSSNIEASFIYCSSCSNCRLAACLRGCSAWRRLRKDDIGTTALANL